MVTKELNRLKQGINAGTIKLPKPPPQKVKGRQIVMINNIEIGGDRLEDMEYMSELNCILDWCFHIENLRDIDRKFQENRHEFAYIYYKNGKIFHFGQDESDLLFIVL